MYTYIIDPRNSVDILNIMVYDNNKDQIVCVYNADRITHLT